MRSLRSNAELRRRVGVGGLVVAHLGLLVTFDLAARPVATLGFMALGFGGLLVYLLGCRSAGDPSRRALLSIAVLLRILLIPLAPTLSDDVLRYVWDGRVLASGANPYAVTPEDPALVELRDARWDVMPHKDVATVYPPAALAVFSIAAHLPLPVYGLKAILALVDLAGCWILFGLARRRGLPTARVAAYAWNPLLTLEVAGMGHVDALGVTAVILAVASLGAGSRRPGRAGAWAGFGTLAKLVPVVALPMWARQSRSPVRFLAVAVMVVVVGSLPVLAATGGVPPGLVRYAVSWEFNGPVFEPLWRGLDAVGAPDAVASALDRLKSATGRHELWNRFYHYRYPQFLAKLLLWLGILVTVLRSLRWRDPVAGTGRLLGGVMLLSATVYPWYLIWVLPWAALCRQRAWLALAALVQLSYLPQMMAERGTPVTFFPWIYLVIWLPFAVLLASSRGWSAE